MLVPISSLILLVYINCIKFYGKKRISMPSIQFSLSLSTDISFSSVVLLELECLPLYLPLSRQKKRHDIRRRHHFHVKNNTKPKTFYISWSWTSFCIYILINHNQLAPRKTYRERVERMLHTVPPTPIFLQNIFYVQYSYVGTHYFQSIGTVFEKRTPK